VGPKDHVLDGVQIPPWEGAILRGKGMPADLSPLAAANELVRRLCCGGIIAHAERLNSSSRGVRCGLTLTTCYYYSALVLHSQGLRKATS